MFGVDKHSVFGFQRQNVEASNKASQYFKEVELALLNEVKSYVPSDIKVSPRYTSIHRYRPENGFSGWTILLRSNRDQYYEIEIGRLSQKSMKEAILRSVALLKK